MYTLQQGQVEQKILEQCMRSGMKIPDRIQNAPELNFGLFFYFQSFLNLSRERPQGFGIAAIPLSSILTLAEWEGFNEEETEDFVYHIKAMDIAFMEHHRKKDG